MNYIIIQYIHINFINSLLANHPRNITEGKNSKKRTKKNRKRYK